VVGGGMSGGIVVKTGEKLATDEHPDGRLARGSVVAELKLKGERLRYTLLAGDGPKDGWVSLTMKGRPLLIKAGEEGTKAYDEAKEVEAAKAASLQAGGSEPRVWLMPQGTRGDAQPVVALGVALRKAGMQVRILAPEPFRGFVESYGLSFTVQGVDIKAKMDQTVKDMNEKMSKAKDGNSETPEQMTKYQEDPHAFGGQFLDECFGAEDVILGGSKIVLDLLERERPDVIISHALNGIIPFVAWAKAGIPVFGCEFFPSMFRSDEEFDNTWSGWSAVGAKIEEATGVNPCSGGSTELFKEWSFRRNYCFTSPSLLDSIFEASEEPISDWMRTLQHRLSKGFMVLDPTLQMVDMGQFGGGKMLVTLQKYLEAGPPPVYIGWGSMPVPTIFLIKLFVICRVHKLRVIVCTGWGGHTYEAVEKLVTSLMPEDPMGVLSFAKEQLFVSVAPHEWLFPRCVCTIHHGGAGTTCAALRAGRPTIVTPFLVDQFAYASWVTCMGVGVSLNLQDDVERILPLEWSKQVKKVVTDPVFAEKAKAIGEKLRSEQPLPGLAKEFSEFIQQQKSRTEPGEPIWGCS